MPAILSPSRHLRIGRAKAGLGLFARVPIQKGQFIIRYHGRKIPTETTEGLDTRYLFEINNSWTIDGSHRSNRARYINHSCRPNAEVYFVKLVIKIRAIKNIKPGDEITYHYGRNYFDAFIRPVGCKCLACAKKRAKERAEKRAKKSVKKSTKKRGKTRARKSRRHRRVAQAR
ncbi:MAG: uncharacterized protein QOI40_4565 [Alphaproteobacteria bacterium]|jgi:SET domain-containing protein|nr:uncharacterized protein [Alphaproteobacteria bacterium]